MFPEGKKSAKDVYGFLIVLFSVTNDLLLTDSRDNSDNQIFTSTEISLNLGNQLKL
jgi:hypothetical protein